LRFFSVSVIINGSKFLAVDRMNPFPLTLTYCTCARVHLSVLCKRCFVILSYKVGDSCTKKTEIIFIQFQLLILLFPFVLVFFSIFSFSSIIIVSGIKFYLFTE